MFGSGVIDKSNHKVESENAFLAMVERGLEREKEQNRNRISGSMAKEEIARKKWEKVR